MRWLWFALGWLMVGLGVIGALLPVMPTTIFLILAVGCFARSSPKFEQRLLAHPRYGPSLRLWREQGAVSGKGKAFASAGMAAGFALFCWGRASVVAPVARRGPVLCRQRRLRAQPAGTATGAPSGRGSGRRQRSSRGPPPPEVAGDPVNVMVPVWFFLRGR